MRKVCEIGQMHFAKGRHMAYLQNGGDFSAVRLPHDWNADAPPYGLESGNPSNQGYIHSQGDGTYRVRFGFDGALPSVYLLADGIYRNAKIYVNDVCAGGSPYGYIPMTVDLSSQVRAGSNLLEIYVDNTSEREDRWYAGAGIYRRLSLLFAPETHFIPSGIFVSPKIDENGAEISVSAEIAGDLKGKEVFVTVSGAGLDDVSAPMDVSQGKAAAKIRLAKPSLWSPETPCLYTATLTIVENGKVLDLEKVSFGVRKVEFDAKQGLRLNGEPILLCGVNLHHDSGALGAAFFPSVWKERLETLKSFGCNAVRVSHNPQAKAFYDLCDEIGLLVIDELYDKWDDGSYDTYFWNFYEKDVAAWVRRDRNHPCVILYSVGNEVARQGLPTLFHPLRKLVAEVKKHDDTRPISFGMHPFGWPAEVSALSGAEKAKLAAKIAEVVDVLLCNYQEQWYALYHKEAPEACIIGSELYHWYTSAGDDIFDYTDKHPWEYVHALPYVLGGFYWAGIDYRGESAAPPARGWSSDLLDITGFPKVQAHLAQAYWTEKPMVAGAVAVSEGALPNTFERKGWSFPPCVAHLNMLPSEGPATVMVFTNCESASLWQNGEKIAHDLVKTVGRCLFFEAELNPSETLWIVGENGGQEAARFALSAFGKAEKLHVSASESVLSAADSESLAIVRVQLTDGKGRPCEENGAVLSVSTENLTLLGIDNGDIAARHSYHAGEVPLFFGRAVLFVRGKISGAGKLRFSCNGLQESLSFTIQ